MSKSPATEATAESPQTKSRYQPASAAAADAAKRVEWATWLLEGADEVVSSR